MFKHLSLSGKIDGLVREEQLMIPYRAIREGIINALCHRQYRSPGGSVSIAIYDDRVEIANPGTLPLGWNVAKLKSEHNSEPQNPLIANVLYKRKVSESWGRGISLMMQECRNVGLPDPEFKADKVEIRLIFRYKISSLNNPAQVTGQVTMLLRALGQDALSLKEMMSRLSLSGRDNFLKTYLNPAMKQNLIEQTHPENPRHRNQRYRLTYQGKLLLKSL